MRAIEDIKHDIRRGIPVDVSEALAVIDSLPAPKPKKVWWRRLVRWLKDRDRR